MPSTDIYLIIVADLTSVLPGVIGLGGGVTFLALLFFLKLGSKHSISENFNNLKTFKHATTGELDLRRSTHDLLF